MRIQDSACIGIIAVPLFIVSLLIQIALVVHVIRTGRDQYWIYLIVFLPGVGSAAYIITQVLPDLGSSRRVRSTTRRIGKAVDPHREVRRCRDQLEISDNVENRLALADACADAGLDREARDLYQSCLSGPYEHDPHILLKLARCEFALTNPAQARQLLDRLIEQNPDFQSTDGHLLYARSLEEMGETEAARKEYAALADAFPGEEARVRYALLLKREGDVEEAVKAFRHTLLRSKRAPGYYRQAQKKWVAIAKENLD